MSDDYEHGRRDGLRLALAILGGSRSGRTNAARDVRHKALRVPQKRVQTELGRMTPKGDEALNVELAAALDKVGL